MNSIKKILTISGLVLVLSLASTSSADHDNGAKNLAETAEATGSFATLLAAADAAGLIGALSGADQLTVFAPTDEAFAALPKGTVESLLKPQNRDQLANLLNFHTVAGSIGSGSLEDGAKLLTLSGAQAVVQASEDGFTIQSAKIVATDVAASNGVIHVIDRVLMPTASNASASIGEIERAIAKGAPLFNKGNPEATAAIYQFTAENLLMDGVLSPRESNKLRLTLRATTREHDAEGRAWDLRYALDDARQSLSQPSARMMATY